MPPAPEDLLVQNLVEAVKQAHRHIVFGTGAALFLLLLVAQDWVRKSEDKSIQVPIIGVSTDRAFAEIIAAVAYFISGYLAYLSVTRAKRIKLKLASSVGIRDAALTYPSIPTIIRSGTRIAALMLPVVIFLAAMVPYLFIVKDGDKRWALVCLIVALNVPELALIRELRYPLIEVKYKLVPKSFEWLRAQGVADEVLENLKALQDQEYPNRDLFIEAFDKTGAGRQAPPVRRLVLRAACEEEGVED